MSKSRSPSANPSKPIGVVGPSAAATRLIPLLQAAGYRVVQTRQRGICTNILCEPGDLRTKANEYPANEILAADQDIIHSGCQLVDTALVIFDARTISEQDARYEAARLARAPKPASPVASVPQVPSVP